MKLRVYLDTSVIGGCLDEEFRDISRRLMRKFERGEMIAVISDLTALELKDSPLGVQKILDEIPEESIEYVEFTKEAAHLAQKYIFEGVLEKGKLVDAEHIAIATISRIDVLVSWNFRHIVNLPKIRGYNSVNLKYGYPLLEIRSPLEVVSYED
ncbi:MAG TPA: PIN domain protein [Candidatus Tripitaka californicus]|uniref:PIN domain protein n=1 Tax=Candidatus Tripitaka californicus TaxID=3367616 RepID=UPI004027C409|nr:PIN domain protein [Planctomycetota bacterium]